MRNEAPILVTAFQQKEIVFGSIFGLKFHQRKREIVSEKLDNPSLKIWHQNICPSPQLLIKVSLDKIKPIKSLSEFKS